jgi:enoyl-CoA hydratase
LSEVLTSTEAHLGRITLNRPEALHALNTAMCAAMIEALLKWRDDDAITMVMIEHQPGTRGFCAGGDIRVLAEADKDGGVLARAFFFTEYRLNHLLFHYPKPVVALIDGVTMGGGVGISMPAKYRIATENTTFAMPETGIGLFPDVGGGWYLPRLPSRIGKWLALTGTRLKAADCLEAGIATHYVPSKEIDAVRGQAAAAACAHHPEKLLQDGLNEISEQPGPPVQLTPENHALLDRLFRCGNVYALFNDLREDGSDWAKAQLAVLETKSPQTLRVAFRQLTEGAEMKSFSDEMIQEYRIASRVVHLHDFKEGVRALIVDKDNAPQWNPPTLEGVTDEMLDAIFAPLPEGEEWSPLPGIEEKH